MIHVRLILIHGSSILNHPLINLITNFYPVFLLSVLTHHVIDSKHYGFTDLCILSPRSYATVYVFNC
jgi:hypothetical protein